MPIFAHPEFDQHEQVMFCHDKATGLKAIIAVHNTRLGPALGGCRMWPYADEQQALNDVLRLSRGMTYKSALAGLPLGGGKAVIIGDPHKGKSEALFQALGVFIGLREAVAQRLGRSDLNGLRVAIQGLGQVGFDLARQLKAAGAQLWVHDIQEANVRRAVDELGAHAVSAQDIYGLDVDVFSPCAMGAVINDHTLQLLRAPVIAGAANNQLATAAHADELWRRGVLHAPDYAINAGGIIDVSYEYHGGTPEQVRRHVEGIGETLRQIFVRAKAEDRNTTAVADSLAQERLNG
ncbi:MULTISPECIES: Glu/Leu/Phe/Val dehydrogenase dimerization domain-containing protein [unclassified Pseudomonas]|uniref:Glu/Leu/Phe/Val dehydrogenase dimerization domain-containing protein n=1 Tax=unclassified Pseudomonas TaxID=196821 RepID=UPI0007530398|nr:MULTISPECIES: Glu/Leu/Phe/Val dehydrogenase dimerization domain-containing protein [unclassified Pseudomonas]KVV04733.1 Leucine dehydrogenase [Pseudomonas sp. TAD18]KVV06542.1 Leucine dehydrogenase [Pseudomonas sp. TAA207]